MSIIGALSVKIPIRSTVFLPSARQGLIGQNTEMITDVLARIQERLEALNLSEAAASRQAGLSQDAIRNIRRNVVAGKTNFGISTRTLSKLAPVLETTADWLLSGNLADDEVWSVVRGVGRIGAGAMIEPDYEQVPPEGLFQVEVPFAVPEGIVAFEVTGDSMLPRYDEGDVILVYEEQQRAVEALLGEEVAVRTNEGRRYLKRLMRGTAPKTFNLESWNARTIEQVTVEWVGEIYLTVRAGQIRRIWARERALANGRKRRREIATEGMEELPLEGRKTA